MYFRNRKVKKSVGFGSPVSASTAILEDKADKDNFEKQLKINDSFLKVRNKMRNKYNITFFTLTVFWSISSQFRHKFHLIKNRI